MIVANDQTIVDGEKYGFFIYINNDIGYDLNKIFESAILCWSILKTHEQNRISNNSALITLHGVHIVAKIYVINPPKLSLFIYT